MSTPAADADQRDTDPDDPTGRLASYWPRREPCWTSIGILTVAVVTAQVASSFMDQAARSRARIAEAEASPTEISLSDLDDRLARIEALLGPAADR
jgi:hypothetical protein